MLFHVLMTERGVRGTKMALNDLYVLLEVLRKLMHVKAWLLR
jgi:hypothetical protein